LHSPADQPPRAFLDEAQYLKSREHLMEVDARGREYQARADDVLAPNNCRGPSNELIASTAFNTKFRTTCCN
jgi:hypothetical protein